MPRFRGDGALPLPPHPLSRVPSWYTPPINRRTAGSRAASNRFPLRVYFEDTDAGGVVYHANYLRFMERARSDMLRVAGIDQRAALEGGEGVFAIADLAIRYRRPAKLDDALVVVSRVARSGGASCVIQQRVMRDGDTLGRGARHRRIRDARRPAPSPARGVARHLPAPARG